MSKISNHAEDFFFNTLGTFKVDEKAEDLEDSYRPESSTKRKKKLRLDPLHRSFKKKLRVLRSVKLFPF